MTLGEAQEKKRKEEQAAFLAAVKEPEPPSDESKKLASGEKSLDVFFEESKIPSPFDLLDQLDAAKAAKAAAATEPRAATTTDGATSEEKHEAQATVPMETG